MSSGTAYLLTYLLTYSQIDNSSHTSEDEGKQRGEVADGATYASVKIREGLDSNQVFLAECRELCYENSGTFVLDPSSHLTD